MHAKPKRDEDAAVYDSYERQFLLLICNGRQTSKKKVQVVCCGDDRGDELMVTWPGIACGRTTGSMSIHRTLMLFIIWHMFVQTSYACPNGAESLSGKRETQE